MVDLDLEKFFDRVNHDRLMAAIARRVTDKRVLRLIGAFLRVGVMENGLVSPAEEGPRKVDHFLRFYRTSYSMNWTATSNGAGIASCGMRTTAISTSAAEERGSG